MSLFKIIESNFLVDINNFIKSKRLKKSKSFTFSTSNININKPPSPTLSLNKESSNDDHSVINNNNDNDNDINQIPTPKRKIKNRQRTLLPQPARHIQLGNIKPQNVTEFEIAKIASIIKDSTIIFDSSVKIINLPQEKLLSLFLYSIKKKVRNENDLLIIRYYLSTFPSLITTLGIKKHSISVLDILHKLSVFIQYETHESNRIICLNGEIGDKFYMIFEGRVAVFVPHLYLDKLTGIEYVNHLYHLKYLKEYDLLKRTIDANKNTFLTAEIVALSSQIYDCANIFKYHPSDENEYVDRIKPLKGITKICKYEDRYSYITEDKFTRNKYDYNITKRNSQGIGTNDPFSKRRLFTLWTYHKVCELSSGKSFGDIALSKDITNRTATILTLEPSIMGSVSKTIYQFCIKELQDKSRRLNVDYVFAHKLFKGCNKEYFEKNYFNYFKLNTIKRGEYLFKQGEYPKDLFFIYDGELSVESKMTINEMNKVIKYINIERHKECLQEEESLLKKMNILMKKSIYDFFNNRQIFKIFIINNKEIIGLEDYVINRKYFVSGKCLSEKLNFYAIEYDLFLRMLTNEKGIKKNFKGLLQHKKEFMIQRLKYLKKQKMLQYIKTRAQGEIEDNNSKTEYINEHNQIDDDKYRNIHLLSNKTPPLKTLFSFNKMPLIHNNSINKSSLSIKGNSDYKNLKSVSINKKNRMLLKLNNFNNVTNKHLAYHLEYKTPKKGISILRPFHAYTKSIISHTSYAFSPQQFKSPKISERCSSDNSNNYTRKNGSCSKSKEFIREKVLDAILNTSNRSQKWTSNFSTYNTIDCLVMDDYKRYLEKTYGDNGNDVHKGIHIRKGLYKQLRRRVLKEKLLLKN